MELLVWIGRRFGRFGVSEDPMEDPVNGAIDRKKDSSVVQRAYCSLKPVGGYRGCFCRVQPDLDRVSTGGGRGKAGQITKDKRARETGDNFQAVGRSAGSGLILLTCLAGYFLMLISPPSPRGVVGSAASLAPIWLS